MTEQRTNLDIIIRCVMASAKADGKTPEETRDEIVKLLDSAIDSLKSGDGAWSISDFVPTPYR